MNELAVATPIPKVFISYSHDSEQHRNRVLAFSERLRSDGIETVLDQYVAGAPAKGWPRWMLDQLDAADYVLVVCTETYYRRFRGQEEPGKGKGVDWEGALITQEIYDGRSQTLKFVPVFLSDATDKWIPDPLRAGNYYALTSEDAYNRLYDFLLRQAGVEPGKLGPLKAKNRRQGEAMTFPGNAAPSLVEPQAPQEAFRSLSESRARVETREKVKSVTQGFTALVDLMQLPEVRDVVVRFQTEFQAASEQITLLAAFKDFHDALHTIHTMCHDTLQGEAAKANSDDVNWRMLKPVRDTLRRQVDEMQELVGTSSVFAREVDNVNQLELACQDLESSIENKDFAKLTGTNECVGAILGSELSWINNSLTATARVLRLQPLSDAMKLVDERLAAYSPDQGTVSHLRDGMVSVARLGQKLLVLVDQHDKWQQIDDLMRLLGDKPSALNMRLKWPKLSKLITEQCATQAEKWMTKLMNRMEVVAGLFAKQDYPALVEPFQDICGDADDRFFRVDQELKKFCGELREVGTPLVNLLGYLK
ncbi:MAG: TIR domain-containing protein [Planctomycetota bacterium]|nr:TIR domain-containing protein [Planctomycetota bacterium]